MGFEPMNTGFADQRVSHFAIGACAVPHEARRTVRSSYCTYFGCGVMRRYGFTVV